MKHTIHKWGAISQITTFTEKKCFEGFPKVLSTTLIEENEMKQLIIAQETTFTERHFLLSQQIGIKKKVKLCL